MLTGILIILLFIVSLLLFALPNSKHIKTIALLGSLAAFGISIAMLFQFLNDCPCVLTFNPDILQVLGINFKLSIDGLSILLILLTTFLTPLIIFSSFENKREKPRAFYALILLMEMSLVGVFAASDVLLFYIFYELALIPIYFIIALWGGKDAKKITLKFFIYTLIGSLLMLVAILYVYSLTPGVHSFAFNSFYNVILTGKAQSWVFLAFFIAFAIKIPIFPFHTWQPDTYSTAPTQGSMLLAGIMLKMGLYGLIRFVLPLCPVAMKDWGFYAILLSIIGIIYSSLIAIKQNEMKRFIAYSSMAHVGLIAAGIFAGTFNSLEGSIIQMISHGINVFGLFFIYEIIVRRTNNGNISSLGGIASKAPIFAIFFMLILLGNIALPLTNSFVGEFLLMLGIFEYNAYLAFFAGFTIILGAVYMLWMYQRVAYGEVKPATENFHDLTKQEIIILIPIIIMIFWIGIYPSLFLKIAEPVVRNIISMTNIIPN